MDDVEWGDLKVFLAVAQTGGLTPAARHLGISPPTIGRHVARLEAALGQQLFERGAKGYTLSPAGADLLAHAAPMEEVAAGIARWRDGRADRKTVRVSAGSWMSHFLARHWQELHAQDDPFTLALVGAEEQVDIGKHQADIGIRNAQPTERSLARQALGPVAFAAYAKPGSDPTGWIASTASTPSAHWLHLHHGGDVVSRANSPRLVLDLCRAGAGRAVLPCFVGDKKIQIERASGIIDDLTHTQWLAVHQEGRHQSAVRVVTQRIKVLVTRHADLFSGKIPASETH